MGIAHPRRLALKDVPIIFPISLLVIVLLTLFTGAWAISENAVGGQPSAIASSAPVPAALGAIESPEYEWFEQTAIWVCPLH